MMILTIKDVNPPQLYSTIKYLQRFIHPDKIPNEIEYVSKLLMEQLFILLTEKFDFYRKVHQI
jgi:hypothetical protein